MSSTVCFPSRQSYSDNSSMSALPGIPRRTSMPSSRRSSFTSSSSQPTTPTASIPSSPSFSPAPTAINIQPPTPPSPPRPSEERASSNSDRKFEFAFESSSSSDSNSPSGSSKPKRVRGQRIHHHSSPPERSPQHSGSDSDDALTPRPKTRSPSAESARQQPSSSAIGRSAGKNLRINLDGVRPRVSVDDDGATVTRFVSESHASSVAEKVRQSYSAAHTPPMPHSADTPSFPFTSSTVSSAASTITGPPSYIRKKSGELVKSSLKSRRSGSETRGSLHVVTGLELPASAFGPNSDASALTSTRSEPVTPTKNVHFDAQLEHVKLFLAEQKPLAVSRDGSPTDTSGTDSDWPSMIFGKDKDSEVRLVVHKVDLPVAPALDSPAAMDVPVILETLDLEPASSAVNGNPAALYGVVRVRNLAFEKWVAVRFTMDSWQTTSEVTGKYLDSPKDFAYDRFSFAVKLNDVLASSRMEDKVMFLAVRYTVAGREIWDNNSGRNYQVRISKEKVAKVLQPLSAKEERRKERERKRGSGTGSSEEIEDLKSKLEEVVIQQQPPTVVASPTPTVGAFLVEQDPSRQRSISSPSVRPPKFKSDEPLGARYDFAESFKNSNAWQPPKSGVSSPYGGAFLKTHSRTSTYPSLSPSSSSATSPVAKPQPLPSAPNGSSIPFPAKHGAAQPSLSDRRVSSPPPRIGRSSAYNSIFPSVYQAVQSKKPLGSPRDADDEDFRHPSYFSDDPEDSAMTSLGPSLRRALSPSHSPAVLSPLGGTNGGTSQSDRRHHQRGGYFDLGFGTSSVRKTPPGSPISPSTVPSFFQSLSPNPNPSASSHPTTPPGGYGRFNSFPPTDPGASSPGSRSRSRSPNRSPGMGMGLYSSPSPEWVAALSMSRGHGHARSHHHHPSAASTRGVHGGHGQHGHHHHEMLGGSEDSTPSITSPSSTEEEEEEEESVSSSPSHPPLLLGDVVIGEVVDGGDDGGEGEVGESELVRTPRQSFSVAAEMNGRGDEKEGMSMLLRPPEKSKAENGRDSPVNHLSDYSELLSRFCFYTGSGDSNYLNNGGGDLTNKNAELIPRCHSASSVEELLFSQQSPPISSISSTAAQPQRLLSVPTPTIKSPSSEDDIVALSHKAQAAAAFASNGNSGSATPQNRTPTPTMGFRTTPPVTPLLA